jgi:hypothetical protein
MGKGVFSRTVRARSNCGPIFGLLVLCINMVYTGPMSITQKETARSLEISLITVSRAINNTGSVSPKLKKNEPPLFFVKRKKYKIRYAKMMIDAMKALLMEEYKKLKFTDVPDPEIGAPMIFWCGSKRCQSAVPMHAVLTGPRHGAFAEYVVVPDHICHPLPVVV